MSRRYRKAMQAFAMWWHEKPGKPECQYLPTEPAPMLIFSGDSKFVLFLTIRADQFELVLDDIGVASIPSRQILGPLNTPYMDIMGRVVGTTEWYAGENRQAGRWQRALWYYTAVSSFAAAFKDREAGRRIAYIRYQIAEEETVNDAAAAYRHLSLSGRRIGAAQLGGR